MFWALATIARIYADRCNWLIYWAANTCVEERCYVVIVFKSIVLKTEVEFWLGIEVVVEWDLIQCCWLINYISFQRRNQKCMFINMNMSSSTSCFFKMNSKWLYVSIDYLFDPLGLLFSALLFNTFWLLLQHSQWRFDNNLLANKLKKKEIILSTWQALPS